MSDPADAFDAAIIINLKRRPERLNNTICELHKWPFSAQPYVMNAIDGDLVLPPEGFMTGLGSSGVWGCLQSHRHAIEKALNDGHRSVLILEDDAVFCHDFRERAIKFMSEIPSDWEFAFLGGHHWPLPAIRVSDGIVRPQNMDRMHAYAARGKGLIDLYRFLHEPHATHVDSVISQWVSKRKTYCPHPWLVGQRNGESDIGIDSTNYTKLVTVTNFFDKDTVLEKAPEPPIISRQSEDGRPMLTACLPTRGRAKQCARSIESFYETTKGYERECIVVSHPDDAVPLLRWMEEDQERYPGLKVFVADTDAISAWNLAFMFSKGFWISISDDDLIYTPHWFDAVVKKHDDLGRPEKVMFGLHDPDFRVMSGQLFTRSILSRRFCMEVMGGVLCAPIVKRWWNDNITTDLARKHNCGYPCFESVIKHNQAMMGLSPWDATAQLGKDRGEWDEANYLKWKADGMNVTWAPVVKE